MATFARAHTGPANAAFESFSAARTSMMPRFEPALTSLVVVALVIAGAIISIAALAHPAPYGNVGMARAVNSGAAVNPDETMALKSYNRPEAEVLDRDLYPFCLDVGDSRLPSTRGRQMLGWDHRIFEDFAGRAVDHKNLAAAKSGPATEAGFLIPRPAAGTTPLPNVAFVSGISDLGCGVGNYK